MNVRTIKTAFLLLALLFGYSWFHDNGFDIWKEEFQQLAREQGIQDQTLQQAFHNVQPDQKVLRLDAHQPEFIRPIWEYLESIVSDARLNKARIALLEHQQLLTAITARYPVDKEYLVAIWGIESNFGQHTGRYSVIRSLATLAYQGRPVRRLFWREQLLAALRILQNGDMPLRSFKGSWAGAMGQTQFIPSTFERFAVDFDGDGRINLKESLADALASTAHYLVRSGWRMGQPWGELVRLGERFDWAAADSDIWQSTEKWQQQHVRRLKQPHAFRAVKQEIQRFSGTGNGSGSGEEAFIFLPAGHQGPAFMVYRNFEVLLKYNASSSYALAVGYMGELLKGQAEWQLSWPSVANRLSFKDSAELQALLSAAGYNTEGVDGKIGPNTQSALKQWQADVGFPADGYATQEHLELLRLQVELEKSATPPF